MAENLPNELTREILQYALHVPDAKFRDVSEVSPFSFPAHVSSSAVLAVCKRWMSVATPLLYHVVILRSKAQAQALERTLRLHKDFGSCVKKLRLEGGYGDATRKIILASPNITDLWISLAIRSSDNTKGLCKALEKIDPTCVVIRDAQKFMKNAPLTNLLTALSASMARWTNLQRVYLSDIKGTPSQIIMVPLSRAPSLRSIVVPLTYISTDARALQILVASKSLQSIEVYVDHAAKSDNENLCSLNDALKEYPDLESIVVVKEKYPERQFAIVIAPPSNPCFIPMGHASQEIRDTIWDRIIQIATDFESYQHLSLTCEEQILRLFRAQQSVSQVSRTFRRLALPHIFSHPIFLNDRAVKYFALTLHDNPSLGSHIRSIRFSSHVWFLHDSNPIRRYIHQIVLHAPRLANIKSLHSANQIRGMLSRDLSISWSTFAALAENAGPSVVSLRNISVHDEVRANEKIGFHDESESEDEPEEEDGTQIRDPPSSLIFAQLPNLRSLKCRMAIRLKIEAHQVPRDSLSKLESISFTSQCDSSFFDVLSSFDLNSLRHVVLKSLFLDRSPSVLGFLRVHGPKLQTLDIGGETGADGGPEKVSVFDLCPRITTIRLRPYQFPEPKIFYPDHQHICITKVIVSPSKTNMHPPYYLKEGDDFFFSAVDFSAFPALREIQFTFDFWPDNEYDMEKSPWIMWSDDFAKKWNIKLTDSKGRAWRHRLTSSKGSRRA